MVWSFQLRQETAAARKLSARHVIMIYHDSYVLLKRDVSIFNARNWKKKTKLINS